MISSSAPTIIYEDNKSAINIIHNGNDKDKHKDIRYHHVRELVHQQHLSVLYRPTSKMTADILTNQAHPYTL